LSTTLFLADGNGPSFGTPALSGDGRYVSFQSSATNLVGDDTDHVDDVFTRAAIVPTINKVAPTLNQNAAATIARGTDAFFLVKGTYFLPDTKVIVAGNGLTSDTVTVISETQLSVHITA